MNVSLAFGQRLINQQLPGVFVNISTTYAETGSAYVVPLPLLKQGVITLLSLYPQNGVSMDKVFMLPLDLFIRKVLLVD